MTPSAFARKQSPVLWGGESPVTGGIQAKDSHLYGMFRFQVPSWKPRTLKPRTPLKHRTPYELVDEEGPVIQWVHLCSRWSCFKIEFQCKLVQALWKAVWSFLKKPKTELPHDPAIPLLGVYLDKNIIRKDPCTPLFTAALFTIAKTWKQPKCPSQMSG